MENIASSRQNHVEHAQGVYLAICKQKISIIFSAKIWILEVKWTHRGFLLQKHQNCNV